MADLNLTKSELAITLGGTERVWRLDWKAIRELENAATQLSGNGSSGKRVVWQHFLARYNEWCIDDWGLLLWAGLHRKDSSITYNGVMEEADVATLGTFQLLFNEIVTDSIPERFKKKSVSPLEVPQATATEASQPTPADASQSSTAELAKSAPEAASVSA